MLETTMRQCWPVQVARLLLSTVALVATMVAAQPTGGQPALNESVGADLGTGWNILQIPAWAFAMEGPNQTARAYSSLGYANVTANHTSHYAPVYLPSGAAIGFLDLYSYDLGPDTIVANLRRYTGYGGNPQCPIPPCLSVPPGTSVVLSVSSIGDAGYQYVSSAELNPPHTVNNNVRYGGGAQYVVEVNLPPNFYGFKAVDIWWKRQISPAPGSARFTDVPIGAQFFAEIEALAASGITLGCTATTFCPNATLTRAQMAAFLARALGLSFPY